jgi:hypothetical protein
MKGAMSYRKLVNVCPDDDMFPWRVCSDVFSRTSSMELDEVSGQ